MAAYVEYNPGPTIAEQHDTMDEVLDAFWSAATPERTGVIGASASLTWYLTGASYTAAPNPSINLLWSSTTGGHTATTFVRHDAALNGMLDPAYTWMVRQDLLQFLSGYVHSVVETWRGRVGGTTPLNGSVVSSLLSSWLPNLLGGGSTSGTGSTALAYTDGTRAGTLFGFRLVYAYDPTAGELTAGVRQVAGAHVALVSDAGDGTINAGSSGTSIGTAIVNVPVPVVGTPAAEAQWADWMGVQPLDKRNVSHIGDLGGGTPVSSEPTPGEAVPIYQDPGQVPEIAEDPGLWDLLTTVPSFIVSFFLSAGRLAASIAGAGIVSLLGTALVAIEASKVAIEGIQTGIAAVQAWEVDAIADNTRDIADRQVELVTHAGDATTALEAANTQLGLIKTAIEGVDVALDVTPVVDALDRINSTSPGNLNDTLQSVTTGISAVATEVSSLSTPLAATAVNVGAVSSALNPSNPGSFAKRLVEAMESIADSLKADGTSTPPADKVSLGLAKLIVRMAQVAESTGEVNVKFHGIEVDARAGIIEE